MNKASHDRAKQASRDLLASIKLDGVFASLPTPPFTADANDHDWKAAADDANRIALPAALDQEGHFKVKWYQRFIVSELA